MGWTTNLNSTVWLDFFYHQCVTNAPTQSNYHWYWGRFLWICDAPCRIISTSLNQNFEKTLKSEASFWYLTWYIQKQYSLISLAWGFLTCKAITVFGFTVLLIFKVLAAVAARRPSLCRRHGRLLFRRLVTWGSQRSGCGGLPLLDESIQPQFEEQVLILVVILRTFHWGDSSVCWTFSRMLILYDIHEYNDIHTITHTDYLINSLTDWLSDGLTD